MNRPFARSIATMGAATLLFSGAATLLATHAGADTTPPWEASGVKDANEVGTLVLYDSSGTQVTTGSVTDAPLAAYMVGSTADTAHVKATAYLYTPKNGVAAGAWAGEQISLSTSYPVAAGPGVPTVVSGTTAPVVTGAATDETIATYIGDFPNTDTTTAGYVNAYQLRVKTSSSGQYQSLDFTVSNLTMSSGVVTGGTWTETYPGIAATATTTTLTASPAKATEGSAVTLKATESAGSAHPAGSVQFYDGTTAIGSAVTVSSGGVATYAPTDLPVGSDAIKATFTPTDSTTYLPSTSTTKTVTITAAAAKKLKNTAKPKLSGKHKVGKKEKVSDGKWSPKPSKFTYQWFLGSKKIKGATKSSFKPVKKDKGKKISCTVTAKKSGYKSASASSKAVKVKK